MLPPKFPLDFSLHTTAEAIRAGRQTCIETLDACLARIKEDEHRVRAWVLIDESGARTRAEELDRDLRAGRVAGPLHGIPIAIKDIVDVAGWPTRAGSALLGQTPAQHDATIVKRLRDAGAVIVGKTATTQYASFDPPVTRNPWSLDRTPGGSSSGSAAAVACGMVLGAVGSQTGGSITRPATYCGVAGCKPTYARVSLHGILPLAPSMDHPGPIAPCVRDLAILLDVMAGPQLGVRDQESRGREQESDVGVHLSLTPDSWLLTPEDETAPPRIGRLRGLFEEQADGIVVMALQSAIQQFEKAGAAVIEAKLPASFDDVIRQHRIVMCCEAAAYHEQHFKQHPEDYLPRITELLEEGLRYSCTDYIRARQHQARLKQEILASFIGVDALICPATTSPAPSRLTTGDPAFNSPWSYTGLPVISFPVMLSADGLPLGIQLIGRPFDEPRLFQVAEWCERSVRPNL